MAAGQYSPFAAAINSTGSVAWPASNRAIFIPFHLESPELIAKLVWCNGSAVSGNVDIGIYTIDDVAGTGATRIVSSGSTAQSGTNARQAVDITDTMLGAGSYYLALALDNTTGTIFGRTLSVAIFGAAYGAAVQESAFPLPATASLVTYAGTFFPIALAGQTAGLVNP